MTARAAGGERGMIEATGLVTLIADANRPGVAVPDVVPTFAEDGVFYHKLLELIGQEVYVLVLPRDEMLAMCQCNHTLAEHLEFENWHRDSLNKSTYYEPSLSGPTSHVRYQGRHPSDTQYCQCREFKPIPQHTGKEETSAP
jgi:hypothetical protein